METVPFWKELLNLGKELVVALFKLFVSVFEDLHSFRNKLVLITTVICFYVFTATPSETVQISALSIWSLIVAFYFKKRYDSAVLEAGIKDSAGSVIESVAAKAKSIVGA